MPNDVSRYRYNPSLPVAILAAVLYGIAFLATLVQWVRFRAWVWAVMVVASGMEAGGYIARCLSIHNLDSKTLYVVQYVLVVLAPVLMAGACYVVFGRIVFHVVPKEQRSLKLLWISPRWLTPIFVIFDIVALMVQLVGAIIITSISPGDANIASKANRGKTIAQIGVILQLICFGLFTIIAARFNFTAKRFISSFEGRLTVVNEKYVKIDGSETKIKRNWMALLHVTNVACVCILIRSVYRLVEFSLGRTGYPESHEWVPYCFDTLPILPVAFMFAWWHPAIYLPYLGFRLPKEAR